jgi:hypothetical protein
MPKKSDGMSKTMRDAEAASIARAMKGKPEPVSVKYQIFIEKHQGQQKLPMDFPPGARGFEDGK